MLLVNPFLCIVCIFCCFLFILENIWAPTKSHTLFLSHCVSFFIYSLSSWISLFSSCLCFVCLLCKSYFVSYILDKCIKEEENFCPTWRPTVCSCCVVNFRLLCYGSFLSPVFHIGKTRIMQNYEKQCSEWGVVSSEWCNYGMCWKLLVMYQKWTIPVGRLCGRSVYAYIHTYGYVCFDIQQTNQSI